MKLPEIPGSIIAQMATVPAMKNPSKLAEKGIGGASEIATASAHPKAKNPTRLNRSSETSLRNNSAPLMRMRPEKKDQRG